MHFNFFNQICGKGHILLFFFKFVWAGVILIAEGVVVLIFDSDSNLSNQHFFFQNQFFIFFQETSFGSIWFSSNNCLFWDVSIISITLFRPKSHWKTLFTNSFPSSVLMRIGFPFEHVRIFSNESFIICPVLFFDETAQ